MSSNIEKHLDIDPCDIDMTEQIEALQNELHATKLEKDEMEMSKNIVVAATAKLLADQSAVGASAAVAPGSGKKIIYNEGIHKITHAKVEVLTAPALLELKKLENNYDAIWWCSKHIERLGKGDKPDGYDKYVAWGNKNMTGPALQAYMPLAAEELAAGSP